MSYGNLDPLWDDYLRAEESGVRAVILQRLDAVLEGVSDLSPEEARSWAREIMVRAQDTGEEIPIRYPLFDRVLYPVLLEGLEGRDADSARWLAGFGQLLRDMTRRAECLRLVERPPDSHFEAELLRAAVRWDPDNDGARAELIREMRQGFEYTLHELPAGVLAGVDGASEEGCQELLRELEEFAELVEEDGSLGQHGELIEQCRLHYRAYPDYLRRRDSFPSYADYLNRMES